MGAFFGSIHVRTDNSDLVRNALERVAKEADCKFLMGPPVEGWISVFSNEDQNDEISAFIAKYLPNDIFHFIVHDDSVFNYSFYRAGQLVDNYNSCPNYFDGDAEEYAKPSGGRPELFQDLLRRPDALAKIKELLAANKEQYIFENERMSEFVELLGLSNASSSYEYLQSGEWHEIEGREQFIHIEVKPESAEDYNSRGEVKLAKGDLDGALADFDKALERNPGLTAAQENRVRVEQAKIDRDKTFAEHWNQFGNIKKAEGDLHNALFGYNKAIELNPNLAEVWNNRGRVKKEKGDQDGALADYNRAIELKPDMAVAYSNRGLVKKARKDLSGALADFDRAIELKPDMAVAYSHRGIIKQARRDMDGALADFDKAIELKPDLASAYNNRGQLKRAKGDSDGAIADFNKSIELKPSLAEAFNNRGEAKRAKGDIDGALADYNKAIELKPKLAQPYNNRAITKRSKGDLDGALADFDKVIELTSAAVAYGSRGTVKREKGDLDGALADFNKALELKPDWTQAREARDAVIKSKGGPV
jgi:tetratricopeptide (TPR) repeat protein